MIDRVVVGNISRKAALDHMYGFSIGFGSRAEAEWYQDIMINILYNISFDVIVRSDIRMGCVIDGS